MLATEAVGHLLTDDKKILKHCPEVLQSYGTYYNSLKGGKSPVVYNDAQMEGIRPSTCIHFSVLENLEKHTVASSLLKTYFLSYP